MKTRMCYQDLVVSQLNSNFEGWLGGIPIAANHPESGGTVMNLITPVSTSLDSTKHFTSAEAMASHQS